MPSFRLLMPFSTLFFLAACEKKPAPLPPLPVAPTPAVRVEAPPQKERLSVNDAMTVNEVAFAMRAGGNDAELVAEIVRRGLVDKIDEPTAKELAASGASPAVLAALRDPRNILTAAEKARYNERAARRTNAQVKR